MAEIVIFGGTAEGRQIAEMFQNTSVKLHICVATQYGATLLPKCPNIIVRAGRMDEAKMRSFLEGLHADCCVDATHPYAAEVTGNLSDVCRRLRLPYIRICRRDTLGAEALPSPVRMVCKPSVEAAVAFLRAEPGNILITTGSKELARYTKLPDYKKRCFARVLPTAQVVAACAELGFEGKNLIAMQGPFTEELNYCLMRQVDARWLVTKSSGKEGGYKEKCDAAARAGVNILVVARPKEDVEYTMELEEAIAYLRDQFGAEALPLSLGQASDPSGLSPQPELPPLPAEDAAAWKGQLHRWEVLPQPAKGTIILPEPTFPTPEEDALSPQQPAPEAEDSAQSEQTAPEREESAGSTESLPSRTIWLVGMGPGAGRLLTAEARECLEKSEVLIGAKRMLELCPSCQDGGDKPFYESYRREEIVSFLEQHPEHGSAAVVYSGDIGFYSGAKGMKELLEQRLPGCSVSAVSGISSPVYLMNRLGIPWEDVLFISCHGKKTNLTPLVGTHRKVCALFGEGTQIAGCCRELSEAGHGQVEVTVGERLSYPDERIVTGTARELAGQTFHALSVALFQNPSPAAVHLGFGISDDAFIRGNVPMTKEEVRTLALSKLRLHSGSILYDIGAGTGSVAVEAALRCERGYVYAIEKKPEAAALIAENRRKFQAGNLTVVEGEAPACLEGLETPTHAFIGGSGGSLPDIIRLLREKNNRIRIVATAVTLETVSQMEELMREDATVNIDVTHVQIAKSRAMSGYHLMSGENPVYIFCVESR